MTVGFRPNIGNNWGVFGEVGATYLGKADANITANGTGRAADVNGQNEMSVDSLAAQAERDIEAKDYANWFPIVKVGATYRF